MLRLSQDSKAAGRWETNYGGEYFGAGVGGAITGRGADLLIIDDPHSEQDAQCQQQQWTMHGSGIHLVHVSVYNLADIVCVMTRWSEKDLTGNLMRAMGRSQSGSMGRH